MVHNDQLREHVVSASAPASIVRRPVSFGGDHDDRNVLTTVRSVPDMFDEACKS